MNEKKKIKGLPKRILSFVLTMAMVLTLMPGMSVTAVAAESGDAGGGVTWRFEDLDEDTVKETLHFSKTGDGDGKMTGYRGTYEHPERFVPEWENQVGYDNITNVIFDEGIVEIGECAILGDNIKNVTIPDNIFVNRWAFEGCTNLTDLSLGSNITTED